MGKLFQQNKNVCMMLQNAMKQAISDFEYYKPLYIYFNQDNYELYVEGKIRITYSSLSWEEAENQLFLMVKPHINIENDTCSYFDDDITDILGILTEHIKRNYDFINSTTGNSKRIINDMCRDANCKIDELINDANGIGTTTAHPIRRYLYPKLKKNIQEVLSLKVDITVHPKLFPNVKDRTKIPLLIYDPNEEMVRHLDSSYFDVPKNTLFSKKATALRGPRTFVRYSRDHGFSMLSYLPLDRWLNVIPERSRYATVQIRL